MNKKLVFMALYSVLIVGCFGNKTDPMLFGRWKVVDVVHLPSKMPNSQKVGGEIEFEKPNILVLDDGAKYKFEVLEDSIFVPLNSEKYEAVFVIEKVMSDTLILVGVAFGERTTYIRIRSENI